MLTSISVARRIKCGHSKQPKHDGHYRCYPGGAGSRLTRGRRGYFKDLFLKLQKVYLSFSQHELFAL